MHTEPQLSVAPLPSASTESALYYLHVPNEPRSVCHEIDFLSVQDFLAEDELARDLWDLAATQFKTRSKFLAIWPNVRFVAVYRHGEGLGGFLLVTTPLNWQIDYVTVRPELRHQGIAASLVAHTVNEALERGVPYLMLTSKPSLRPLYEGQCGFRVVGSNAPAELAANEPRFAASRRRASGARP